MANWNSMTITNAGLSLQAKVNTGAATFKIAGISIGSGTPQGSLSSVTELAHKEMDVPISKLTTNNNVVSIEGTITNESVTTAFAIREMGLYAQDGDNADTKVLYGIMTDPNPDSLPAHGSATVVSQKFTLNLTMSNTGNVTATIDPNALVTVGDLEEHNTSENAHQNIFAKYIKKAGDTMTGALQLLTPSDDDDSTKAASTGWVRKVFSGLLRKAITASGVRYLMAENGYICLGDLFGGLIIQWGFANRVNGESTPVTLPVSASVLVAFTCIRHDSKLHDDDKDTEEQNGISIWSWFSPKYGGIFGLNWVAICR